MTTAEVTPASELVLSFAFHAELTIRATIRRFVVAGQFIEVLRCFENGMTEEVGCIFF